tara:strand:- start:1116 stop:1436 length:321 start_codon:yes stop_codon:yes gene_type:complete
MKKSNKWEGTSLQGRVEMPYEAMVRIFGEPHFLGGEGDKTDVEWCFEEADMVFTLYNWKDGVCYNGSEGYPIKFLSNWHIGGKTKDVFYLVEQIINSNYDKVIGGK